MKTEKRSYDTGGSRFTDITRDVEKFAAAAGEEGVVHVFEGLLPRDDHWVHSHGSTGHGADHLLPAFMSPSLTLPVVDGRLDLGAWQSIVLVDFNQDNPQRKVRLSFLPG